MVPTSRVSRRILSSSAYLMYLEETAVTALLFLSLLGRRGKTRKRISDINL
jgi:hypothetical protein